MYCKNYGNVETIRVYVNHPYLVTLEPVGYTNFGIRRFIAYITKLAYSSEPYANAELSDRYFTTRKVLFHTYEQSNTQIAYSIVRQLEKQEVEK